jgi:hypothetical protein
MIVNVGPAVSQQLTVTLYESTRLECQAEGNPQPRYQWLHRRPKDGEEDIVIRSEDRYLHITNVTYEHQGEYICIATSTINGLERMVQSEAITLRVVGKKNGKLLLVFSRPLKRKVKKENGLDRTRGREGYK